MMNSCDTCQYAYFDEETGEAVCDLNLDEDEIARLGHQINELRKQIDALKD